MNTVVDLAIATSFPDSLSSRNVAPSLAAPITLCGGANGVHASMRPDPSLPHKPDCNPELSPATLPGRPSEARIVEIIERGLERALTDQHISHREARELGRELGRTLAAEFHHLADQSSLRSLLATTAIQIRESALSAEHQASCWSNLRKGFIGDTEAFQLGQARSAMLDSAEESLPHLRSMFYRYPNPENPRAIAGFERIREEVSTAFPNLSQQAAHEAALIMYGMGQSRGAPLGDTHERFTQIVPRLLGVCEAYLRVHPTTTLVSLLRPLSRIAAIYERASARIQEGQQCQSSYREKDHRPTNRFDLLARINRVDQLVALTSPSVQTAAASLVSRGSYVGRLYLDTITNFPRYQSTLHCSYPQTRHLLENHYQALVQEPSELDPSPHTLGAPGLREFTATSYINIGLECLNQAPQNPSFHIDSSRDVALLSEFIFEKVARIEYDRLAAIHGAPSSRYGFIAGGANARREYPSFDYDWFLVYERDGETISKTSASSVTNHAFFGKLSRAINTTLSHLGANSDGAYFPHDPISLEAERAVTQERFDRILATCPDPHMELRLRVMMAPLGGDRAFCDLWLSYTNERVRATAPEIMQNQAKIIVEMARAEPEPERLNIKTSPGGLRLGTHLWILATTAFERSFESFEELAHHLRDEGLVTTERAAALVDSYLYLLRLRVRMDMQYGRNDKDLPSGEELCTLAKNLSIIPSRPGLSPEMALRDEILTAMGELRSIIGGSYHSDGSLDKPGIIHQLRRRTLALSSIDILLHDRIVDMEERGRQVRLDFVSRQAARSENLWIASLSSQPDE